MYDVVNMPNLVIRYFSSTPWMIMFIVSTIYIFFRLNTAKKRAMLAAITVFFLFINALVIKVFTHLGQNSTYYRHLWAIPSVAIVGIAVVDLVRIIPKWYLKIPMVAALVIGLWFINGQEYIRCRTQIFSTDGKLVSEDVIELGDDLEKLRNESGRNTLFLVCPTGYERSYGNMISELDLYSGFLNVSDSSFLNDSEHNGEEELTGDNPDVDYVMSTCCAHGIDYLIVCRNNDSEKAYSEKGFDPIFVSETYNLYKCEGYEGIKHDLNGWGKTKWKSWCDKDGSPCLNDKGYCKVEYEYDNRGRKKAEVYKDIDGSMVNTTYGYAKCVWKYGKYGVEEIRLYDSDNNPCIKTNYDYGMIRYVRDSKGRVIEERFYNEKEELINFDYHNPHAIARYEYDSTGNLISEKYYDTNDNPSRSLAGYDEIRHEYDDKNRINRQGYYSDGKLVNRIDTGYAEELFRYNETGEIEEILCYNQDGLLVNIKEV